jgi:probable DNA metabolism protein
MPSYRYDGSWEGLLTVLALVRAEGAAPLRISRDEPPQEELFSRTVAVATNLETADSFLATIRQRLGPSVARHTFLVYLSEDAEAELLICRYLELGWEVGKGLDGLLADHRVQPVHRLARAVWREAHRLKGFVRFREVTDGYYYAQISPEFRVLPLLGRHFAERFRDQSWVIHDHRRSEALLHDAGHRAWGLIPLELIDTPRFTGQEEEFTALWRRYFARLAVAERANPRLQRQKVPLKCREFLPEFTK